MEAVQLAADELCLSLTKTLELLTALTAISADKEAYVTAGDIEKLRAATEKEEEMIADLRKLERDRDFYAGALSEAIGIFSREVTLSALIEAIAEPGLRKRLTDLKNKLNETVNTLSARNEKLSQVLSLQKSYTEYMLNLLYIPRSKGHSYDILGSRKEVSGNLSLFDMHI